jgi:4-amino-4-deoxy-L-arabinose transferase-like glycosyltransferase
VGVREERVAEGEPCRSAADTGTSDGARAGVLPAACLAIGAAALLAIRCDLPGFFDNEGRYAEVAREMLLGGDWITPRLDGTLFLNKPPLTYWLTALAFHAFGPSEWARLVSIAAAAVTLFVTCRIGALLYGARAGLVAGAALAVTLGFALEARTLRPDLVMTASIAVAMWAWLLAERGEGRWLWAFYAALGVGVLAKGLVPVIVAGIPIGLVTLRDHGWRGVPRLRPLLGVGVLAAIVLPWHVLVARAHPGFAWDYVVNQHLLFFLDRKLPRDSEGDPLTVFLIAFMARALPWTVLLPLTLGEAARGLARKAGSVERGTLVAWAWAGGVLLFFSCAPSRLEHYSVPALPAAALLAARAWQRARAGDVPGPASVYLVVAGVALAAVGVLGLVAGRSLLARVYWLPQVPGLLSLVAPAAAIAAVVGVLGAVAAARRREGFLVGTLAVGAAALVVVLLRAQALVEPLFSWRPLGNALVRAIPPEVEIVFEAPEEYQQVGGLVFYTGRPVTLLAPPGFVPPTYLAGQTEHMFLSREEFRRRWAAGEPLVFVSNPQRRRDDPNGLVPSPFRVVARFGDRWLLASSAVL